MKRQVESVRFPTVWQDAMYGTAAYTVIALLPLALLYSFFPL